MFITDDHVNALRAMLSGEMDEAEELIEIIGHSDYFWHFNVVIASAFALAVYRRFGQGYSVPGVIRFIADERARQDDSADDFDPRVAEQLVLSVFTSEPVHGLDDEAKADIQIALLLGMIEDENLDDAELDLFIDDVRKTAEAAMPEVEQLLRRD